MTVFPGTTSVSVGDGTNLQVFDISLGATTTAIVIFSETGANQVFYGYTDSKGFSVYCPNWTTVTRYAFDGTFSSKTTTSTTLPGGYDANRVKDVIGTSYFLVGNGQFGANRIIKFDENDF